MSPSKPHGYMWGRLMPRMVLELTGSTHSFPSVVPDCPGWDPTVRGDVLLNPDGCAQG